MATTHTLSHDGTVGVPATTNVLDLETMKETIRLEIRKELKIKEGAEKIMKASVDRKSRAYVTTILKTCNEKLETLHSELSQLQAQVPDDDGECVSVCMCACTGRGCNYLVILQSNSKLDHVCGCTMLSIT